MLPSVGVNASIPDNNGIPQPWNGRVSSVEAGVGLPGFSATYTATPQRVADTFRYITPAMGPDDELSPSVRSLQSGVGTVGQPSDPPIRYLGRRVQNPLGDGMSGWTGNVPNGNTDSNAVGTSGSSSNAGGASAGPSPASPFATRAPPVPFLPPAPNNVPGGLLGLMVGAGPVDPSNPDPPPAGGLLGLMQEYLRNNPAGNS
jgi:hypothetical protein